MFTFDNVFDHSTQQAQIYDECVKDLVNATFEGFNATILAYGQTGSGKVERCLICRLYHNGQVSRGCTAAQTRALCQKFPIVIFVLMIVFILKCFLFTHPFTATLRFMICFPEIINTTGKTHTMGSAADPSIKEEQFGIIPRVINNLFDMIHDKEEIDGCSTYKVHVQFLEVYGEDVRDLLDHTKTAKVTIRETADGELFVKGAKEEYVGSLEQMMKTLEDGTRNRSTAATKMNQTSSRSHAIFTVFLEHTLHSADAADATGGGARSGTRSGESRATSGGLASTASDSGGKKEVRKSKFHFVDLAGSERAKRTGAHGVQLKEGININQGLLALGNVISALGDEKKRGKVFVPYRDSKLTRMLQDSLGGNSKTLMICCVSPALSNLTESINALRYANRARNIQNKPVVNRDPTLVVIDGLKKMLKVISGELYDIRLSGKYVEVENGVSSTLLSMLATQGVANSEVPLLVGDIDRNNSSGPCPTAAYGGAAGVTAASASLSVPASLAVGLGAGTAAETGAERAGSGLDAVVAAREAAAAEKALEGGAGTSNKFRSAAGNAAKVDRATVNKLKKLQHDLELTQSRLKDADFEVNRLTEKLKTAKNKETSDEEQQLLLKSERDFFKIKWTEASPEESRKLAEEMASAAAVGTSNNSTSIREMKATMGVVDGYLHEIEDLKKKLAEAEVANRQQKEELEASSFNPASDEEFTTNIALLIEQTKQQLQDETSRLNKIDAVADDISSGGDLSDEDQEKASGAQLQEVEDEERAFSRRTQVMEVEVNDIGQSILMKERLVAQLSKSQHQYSQMKEFYEKKLATLSSDVKEKQDERDMLLGELTALQQQKDTEKDKDASVSKAREEQLQKMLAKKDDELKSLKKKKDELSKLSQVQSRYTAQMSKLETEIIAMKKQRVDLSKTLQAEKKSHLLMLNNKAKEIAKLKKELQKSALEMSKLGRGKEMAETRMREALRKQESIRSAAAAAAMSFSSKPLQVRQSPMPQRATAAAGTDGFSVGIASSSQDVRDGIRSVSRIARSGSNNQMYSANELQTKKWLSRRIGQIAARESVADKLKGEYQSQLVLLNQKAALEADRRQLACRSALNVRSNGRRSPGLSHGVAAAESDVLGKGESRAAGDAALTAAVEGADGSGGDGSLVEVLTLAEQQELLQIENSLANIDSQLSARALQISATQQILERLTSGDDDDGLSGSENYNGENGNREGGTVVKPVGSLKMGSFKKSKSGGSGKYGKSFSNRNGSGGGGAQSQNTLEVLKKTSAGSLPAAHELIRLLFDMLLGSQKTFSSSQEQVAELTGKLKTAKREVDEGAMRLAQQRRAHEQALTQKEAEYEEKLFGVFANMAEADSSWLGGDEESGSTKSLPPPAAAAITTSVTISAAAASDNGTSLPGAVAGTAECRSPFPSASVPPSTALMSPGPKHTVISVDEYKFLKEKIQKESMKLVEMQFKVDDVEEHQRVLQEEIDEKCEQIKFLEDDRATFKEMVDDLKGALLQFGRPGKAVLESLKEEALSRRKSVIMMGGGGRPNRSTAGKFAALSSTTYDDIASDDDEYGDSDSDSDMGDVLADAFDFLADEINRTGTAAVSSATNAATILPGEGLTTSTGSAAYTNTNTSTSSTSSVEGATAVSGVAPGKSGSSENGLVIASSEPETESSSAATTSTTLSPNSGAAAAAVAAAGALNRAKSQPSLLPTRVLEQEKQQQQQQNTEEKRSGQQQHQQQHQQHQHQQQQHQQHQQQPQQTASAPPTPSRRSGSITGANSFNDPTTTTSTTTTTSAAKLVVYDRLTNPTYFTGHMKKVFDTEVETKRKKVLQTRTMEKAASQSHAAHVGGGGAAAANHTAGSAAGNSAAHGSAAAAAPAANSSTVDSNDFELMGMRKANTISFTAGTSSTISASSTGTKLSTAAAAAEDVTHTAASGVAGGNSGPSSYAPFPATVGAPSGPQGGGAFSSGSGTSSGSTGARAAALAAPAVSEPSPNVFERLTGTKSTSSFTVTIAARGTRTRNNSVTAANAHSKDAARDASNNDNVARHRDRDPSPGSSSFSSVKPPAPPVQTSVYAKKTENFLAAISARTSTPTLGSDSWDYEKGREKEKEREKKREKEKEEEREKEREREKENEDKARITVSPVSSLGGVESNSTESSAGHTPNTSRKLTPTSVSSPRALAAAGFIITSANATSNNSKTAPNMDAKQQQPQQRSQQQPTIGSNSNSNPSFLPGLSSADIASRSSGADGENAGDCPLPEPDGTAAVTASTSSSEHQLLPSASVTSGASLSIGGNKVPHKPANECWPTGASATPGKWHRSSLSVDAVNAMESSAHLKQLQEQLQQAVNDLGALVVSPSQSRDPADAGGGNRE